MAATSDLLELAIRQAHLPSLIVTLAHLSGRMELLRDDWRPHYLPYTDQQTGGLNEEQQAAVRAMARELLPRFAGGKPVPAPRATQGELHTMMYFVAGVQIPERYLPLLEEELGLGDKPADQDCQSNLASIRDVLVVGAGMSGLLAGIQLRKAGYRFQIIEKNAAVGGTWWSNTYPGCRVNFQNHLYSYSFFPNHDWPHRFSTQEALEAYFESAAANFGLREHIRLKTSLSSARFDEATARWHATIVNSNGDEEILEVDAIISAVGQLNRPKRFPTSPAVKALQGHNFIPRRGDTTSTCAERTSPSSAPAPARSS